MEQNNKKNNQPVEQDFNEIVKIRREKLAALKEAGKDPFVITKFDFDNDSANIKANFEELEGKTVKIAGRIVARRIMGKASFVGLSDNTGKIQLYVRRDDVGEETYAAFKKWDIGDIVGVKGTVFKTQTEEISIHANHIEILAKSLLPLPEKFHGLTNNDLRFRQRYVDLIMNPNVRRNFIIRSQFIKFMRKYLDDMNYIEVETPVLNTIVGGAAARPFITHHNTLDIPLYLRIANELYLKRLIVGGFEGVYEFSRNFRNEGMDRTHNPEFTCLEIYVAYKDYFWMMDFTEQMIEKVALALHGQTKGQLGDKEIDFKRPFARVSMRDAIMEHTGYDIYTMEEEDLRKACKDLGIEVDATMGKGKLIDEIFGEKCEHHYIQPTFIYDYPKEMSPLTKKHRSIEGLTERFELFVNGKELANAYSELNDPIDQLERFQDQLKLQERGDDEAMYIDYDFVRALEYGMPPTSGMGIGIDRLCMFMTNSPSIQDVLLFPQMKPENK